MQTEIDRTIGNYKLIHLLGEGGAARTYLAEDVRDGTRLAVKELQLLKSSNAKQIELFERECSILKELEHPQIPRFIETIVERREETMSLFLVQEFIDGRSLQQILDIGVTFDAASVVAIMRSCLQPLEYLHTRRPPLYHRDIKPSNILLRTDGACVLVDFGAVREAVIDPKTGGSSVVGTFGYMAPEQFQARAYAATDLYALGATAVHLASGMEPGRFEIRRLKPNFHPHVDADPHLAAILDLLLEPAAEDRYKHVTSLRRALDRWQTKHRTGDNHVLLRRTLDAAMVREAKSSTGRPSQPTPRSLPLAVGSNVERTARDSGRQVPREQRESTDTPILVHRNIPTGRLAAVPEKELTTLASDIAVERRAAVESPNPEAGRTDEAEISERTRSAATSRQPDEPTSQVGESKEDAQIVATARHGREAFVGDKSSDTPDAATPTGATLPDPRASEDSRDSADAPAAVADTAAAVADTAAAVADAPVSGDASAREVSTDSTDPASDATRDDKPMVPVVSERAPPSELFIPGGLGANTLGIIIALVGVAIVGVGVFGPLQYNGTTVTWIGSILCAYGLVLTVVPRQKVGQSSQEVRTSGLTAPVSLTKIRRRTSILGGTDWIVDFEYEASDGLHYNNQFRVPSSRVARKVSTDATMVVVRYSDGDPANSILVIRR